MKKLQIKEGTRFGRWTVLSFAEVKTGKTFWLSRCECGNERIIRGPDLRSGHTRSCGCVQREHLQEGVYALKHGHSRKGSWSREYNSWSAMIQRCTNSRHVGFKNYGGRGIGVCERWRNSFENFLADMGPKPPGTSIHRIHDANYEPGQCKWATRKEQANDRRPRTRKAA